MIYLKKRVTLSFCANIGLKMVKYSYVYIYITCITEITRCYHCSTYDLAEYVGTSMDEFIHGNVADIPITDHCKRISETEETESLVVPCPGVCVVKNIYDIKFV